MSSIPIAVAASLGIGVIEQVLLSNPETTGAVNVVICVIIIVALLRQPALGRADEDRGPGSGSSSAAPDRLPHAAGRRWLPRIGAAVVIAVAVSLAYTVSNETASALTAVAGYALVGLSVGLLSGLAGQLSLGQFAYAGIAAAASVHVVASTGNFVLGVLSGVLSGAVVSILVGIPAMRLRGLALAVATLAFALASTSWLLRLDVFLGDGVAPATPTVFGYPLSFAVDYYLLALLLLALGWWFSNNIRHSGFGRIMQALRDNEDAGRAFTVPARMRKLQLYAVSGALAGLGGVVIGHSQSQLTINSFPTMASIDVVALTIIGGLTVTSGPLIGALVIIGIPALVGLTVPRPGSPGHRVVARRGAAAGRDRGRPDEDPRRRVRHDGAPRRHRPAPRAPGSWSPGPSPRCDAPRASRPCAARVARSPSRQARRPRS